MTTAWPLPQLEEDRIIDEAFHEVLNAYVASNHRRKVEVIERAFRFAKEAHKGVRRRSGEPYIMHPIAVAKIVISELGLGSTSICAALLHDVVANSDYTREDIEREFGEKIASIVEGLTKISGGILEARSDSQAENFRKLLLSMSADVRVVLIKMADRLHNMRTLEFVRPEKQLKIAGETLYVYAPLAHRLGLHKIKTELEDLAFRYEKPDVHADIHARITETEEERSRMVEEFIAPIRKKLDEAGYSYEIKTRVKSAFSIYNKMMKKNVSFDEVYDLYAVRVIFDNEDDAQENLKCFEIYTFFTDGNVLHPERTRDWVTSPKPNGYRALHLTAMGPRGKWVEVQIRSRKMDEIAELGYAAHWKYKEGVNAEMSELDKWMGTIKEILSHPEPDTLDFLDTIKLNLFSSEIYVFTPKGDLRKLPKGSTVLDMAFSIHSQLGAHCIAGKINHKLVPMSHVLDSGDQVEIITSDSQNPEAEWLDFVKSARAKAFIGTYLRKDRRQMIKRGERLFNEYLSREGLTPGKTLIKNILAHYSLGSVSELYLMLASDEINLTPEQFKAAEKDRTSFLRRIIRNPFSKSSSQSGAEAPEPPKSRFEIQISGKDRRGVLEAIAHAVSKDMGFNIVGLNLEASGEAFQCSLAVMAESAEALTPVCNRLLKIKEVEAATLNSEE